jgi:glyoxylase-like metal-dependent hydrolase (beta-lactamase superfamily II)
VHADRILEGMNKRKLFALALGVVALPVVALSAIGVRASSHPTESADLGVARSTADLEAVLSLPGPLTVETVTGAKWEIDRSGLVDLEHPKAKEAGLKDGPEPIEIDFHAVRHPSRGLFIVDTGVERALAQDPEHAAIRGPVAKFMHVEKMTFENDTATWLGKQHEPLAGVLLTHLHLDHVSGMPDVPSATPIYAGPGETAPREALNLFSKPIIDRALAGHGAIREWKFQGDASGAFAGVLDVFGDGTLWALSVPGHTPGSTAYLARTKSGPVLMVGDACHTKWGWEHDVPPGTFSHDKTTSIASLAHLRAFVAKHPEIDVRLGHQRLH